MCVLGSRGIRELFSTSCVCGVGNNYVEYSKKFLGKICTSFLIYSIITLCESGLMHITFILQVITKYYVIYFIAQMLAPMFLWHIQIIVLFCFVLFSQTLPFFLSLQDAASLLCVFSAPVLESISHFSKDPSPITF